MLRHAFATHALHGGAFLGDLQVVLGHNQKVYDSLSEEQLSIDQVIRNSGLPSSSASVALLSLEMKRIIRQLPGKMFVKNQ